MTKLKHGVTSTSKKLHSNITGYAMLIPSVIFIFAVSIYPFARGILLSFQNYNLLKPAKHGFIGLDNIIKIITSDTEFYSVLSFSFIYTFLVVLLSYCTGMILALLLNQKIRFRGIFRALILMPWVIPSIVSGTIWKWALNDQFGIINHLLRRWGIINKPLLFFSTSVAARMSVIMTGTWKTFPFMSIVLLASLQSVPKELYESAHIDGAGFFRRFLSITMPMIKGPSMIVTTLQFIWTFNNFENIYLFTRGGPANSTFVMSILTYYTAFYRNDFGYAAALAVVMLIVLMTLSLIYMHVMKSREI